MNEHTSNLTSQLNCLQPDFIIDYFHVEMSKYNHLYLTPYCQSIKLATCQRETYSLYVSLEHRSSHNNTGIFVAIDNNTLHGSKLYIFIVC